MSRTGLYDEDILLWSEQQADVIRRLGRTRRDLPNELDVENVAEEIESVGRSELAAVESFLRLLMIHLIKIASVPSSPAASHWREEARNFADDASIRFSPSMAERMDLQKAWRLASSRAQDALRDEGDAVASLPVHCPWTVEELVREQIDLNTLLAKLRSESPQRGEDRQ